MSSQTAEERRQLRPNRLRSTLRRLAGTRPPVAEEMAQVLYPAFVSKEDVVIEVGSDVGGGTFLLSGLAKQVYAFEPNPYFFSQLQGNTKRNGNIQVFNLGAGSKDETIRLKLPQLANMPRGSRSVPVHLVRLDKTEFALAPSCLVMDCGGSELDALRGSEGLFRSQAIWTVLVETHQLPNNTNTAEQVTLWLLDHGLKTRTRQAPDGSLWVIATSAKRTVRRVDSQADEFGAPSSSQSDSTDSHE